MVTQTGQIEGFSFTSQAGTQVLVLHRGRISSAAKEFPSKDLIVSFRLYSGGPRPQERAVPGQACLQLLFSFQSPTRRDFSGLTRALEGFGEQDIATVTVPAGLLPMSPYEAFRELLDFWEGDDA